MYLKWLPWDNQNKTLTLLFFGISVLAERGVATSFWDTRLHFYWHKTFYACY